MTVSTMRSSIERCDIPEPDSPMLRGLDPAASVAAAATGVENNVDSEGIEEEGKAEAVMAGPQEYSDVNEAAAADAATAVLLERPSELGIEAVAGMLRSVVGVVDGDDKGVDVSLSGVSVVTAGSLPGLRVAMAMYCQK